MGNSTLTRRISNVADGVFDSDAATVGQLNSLNELLQATDTKVGLTQDYFEQKFTDLNTTIDSSKTHYFSISESSDNLSGNKDNTGATSNKADAMAIGPNANATNVKSLAVGNNVYATGLRSIAIGTAPNPTTDAAGKTTTHNTSAEGENSIALGTSTTAQADNSVAIGTRAQTYTTDTKSGKTGARSVAIGNLATTAGDESVALGYSATVKYNYGTAIGKEALASGVDAVAIGKGSKAYSTDSMAIGQDNTVIGNNVYGLGSSNSFSGEWGSIIQSGVSGYKNTITSVSDQDTTNALTGIYMTGNSNTLNQNVKYNVMQDITVQGSSNTIDGGAGGTSSHQNTLSQIAIVGSGNTVQGKSSDDGKTNNIKDVTILGYNNTVDANKDTTVDFSNTQILGNNVTAALGNSVYLGNNAAYVQPNGPAQKAIDAAKTKADTAAEASDEYKAAVTDEDKATIKAQYEAKYLYKLRVQAMEAKGTTAGMNSYDTDETYGNGTNYTYAGSNPTGVITVGSVGSERRIQNVAAGLVSATSTDAVNGSQLYALTRQTRFGGDNSSFGKTTAAEDQNVVARGSNETISITGGSDAVKSSTADGTTTYTVDAAKLTGNNIAVVADKDANALHVQLASNLKDLNTAQLGSGSGDSYKETIKLDGTDTTNGGTLELKDATGANGVTLRTSGTTTTADVNGTATTRLLVNDKTVATTDDGLKFGGDTGTDSALKLNNKLNVKGGADTTKLTDNNIGVVSDGKDTLTVKLNKNVNLGTDGSLTTGTVSAATVTTGNSTLDINGLTITGGPKFTSNGISANNQQIKDVKAGTDDTDAANYSQIKKATTTLTTGKNGNVNVTTNTTPTADGHTNYTIAVDNLKLQATTGDTSVALADGINFKNGTNTTSAVDASGNVTIDTKNLTLKANGGTPATVTMDGGINFKDGKNTTASVGTDGTVTINATHNKLDSASYTASQPSDASNQTTVTLKDTDNNETTLNLTDTYTTVSKNTDHTITFKRNDGSAPVSVSLDDLNGASKEALTTAAAKATTTVIKGTNVDSVEDDTTSADGHHIYKVNVSNLGVKVADGQKKSVALSDGLVFGNGTNTTASVGDNGTITFNVSDTAIKTKAKDAIDVVKGNDNVTIDTTTSTDGTKKTFTISAKDTYTTVTKDADKKTVTFTRNDGNSQTVILNDLGGITAAQDKYITGGTVSYDTNGNGTAALTGTNGITASITGLKDTKVSSGAATYVGTQGDASGSATLTMNDGSKATISGLKDDYITSAAVGTETNHVTMTRLGGGMVDLNLNPILEKYSLSDYHLVGAGTTHDKAYAVDSNGTVTLNVVDDKNPTGTPKTIQITGLASQSGVNAGRTTVKSSDSSVIVDDGTSNSDTHTYDIKVDYSKIPAKLKVQYSGDNGTSGSNTMDKATAFTGTANQIVTTAADGKVSFKLADDISGIDTVTASNSIQAGNVKVGKQGTDGKNYVTGLDNTDWTVGQTTYEAGRAATEDQLKAVSDKVANGFQVTDGTTSANIGADKKVTFTNGTYTTAKVTQATDGANVQYDINTAALNAGSDGQITAPTIDGVATAANVASAINSAAWNIKANDGAATAIKAGTTVGLKAGNNLTLSQNGTDFTYTLNDTLTGIKSLTTAAQDGVTTTLAASGVTIASSDADNKSVSLTANGLNNGGKQITNVASGGTERTNAANIGDLQDAISNASTTTTNTGFNVKGDDTAAKKVKLGKQLNVVGGTTDSTQLSTGNIGVETTADAEGNATLTVKLKKDIALDSVTTGSTTMNTIGISNGDMSLTNTGMIIKNNDVSKQVSITTSGVSMGSQQVKNVADGTDTKDAVNKGQLDVVQTQVTNGWQIVGSNGQKVADIGAGKKVTFGDTTYATASVQPDGTESAKVTYTIKTAGLTADTATGKITEPTTDGVATAQNVAQAINSAAWNIKANDGATTAIKAGTTVGLKAGNNLTLSQSDTDFTYTLNDTLTGIKSLATVDQDGVTTTLTAGGVTIASSGTGNKSVSLTANGLNNGGRQITDVASGGDTDTNAANISDVKRLVKESASGTTETGFNVKGDDAAAKKVKLGKQLNVVGGTNDASKLSGNNIGVVTTTDTEGNATLTVKLNKDINLDSVKTGNTTLNTNGVSNGDMSLTNTGLVIKNNDASKQVSVTTSGVSMGSQRIQNVADATQDTDAATLGQVKNARTKVAAGRNVDSVAFSEGANNQMTYTVNVDNLSVKANNEAAKSVTLKNGLTFNNGTNTTASVDDNGEVKYDLNSTLTGLTSVTAGNSTLDTNGLTIKEGTAPKVVITSSNVTMGGNVIHNVGAGQVGTDAVNKDQLDALQNQVSGGWNLVGKNSDGTAVTAKIGAGKTVTYDNGNYTKAVVTKDDSNNATVKVDVTTGTFGSGTGDKAGTITATANGLATTQDVVNAINSASWTIQDGNNPGNAQQVKAGDTVSLKAGDNLSLDQNGTIFTYGLNKEINISKVTTSDTTKGSTVQTAEGVTTTDAAGNTYIQNGQGITLTPSDETKSPVKLTNSGLNNGGNKITNVADGEVKADSKEAVNGSQLYALQQKVTNGGWDIIGENENRSTHIGNDKTVSFKNGRNSTVSVTGTDTGAEVKVDVNTAQISTDGSTHTATVTGTGLADATEVVNAINSAAWNVQKQGGTIQQVKAGDTVTFDASNNIVLTQNGTSFTYGLAPDVNTKSIRLGGSQDTSRSWTGGIFIGNQIGGGANHNEGNYITGLDNTSWDLSKVVDNRAATEAQLKAAINQITLKEQNGGFALKDESGTEKGKVSQTLGNAIAIVGDTEYESDGKTVKKAGNITTEADGTNVGGIKVKLNKSLDLSDEGSLRVGSSRVSNGAIQLGEDASANKILMDSTNGTASIGGVTVNGAEKTVNGLSNTKWTGKAVDGQAATENQLVEAINEAKTQAANSELHIKKGVYAIGKDSNGQDITDKTSKNSVSIDVVNAKGAVDGQVVINDVAKASELGTVGELADNLKNPAGGSTTVVQAVNKVNQKVDDSLKQVNGDISNAVTEAKKHTKVQSVDSDNNVTIDGTTTNADGGTVYKLGLNKQHMNLDKVHIYGTEGKVTAKDVEAETVKTGNTTVADGRVVVGGDNGIKIEANDGQQTILGLSNRTWNGRAVSGRAATEDQLQQAVENATATAAQNEQHIQAGNYNVGLGKGLDGKAIDKNSVAINVVSGDGTKPGDVKGQVVINNVAKADELGDVAKLNDTVKNADGRPTSTVDAINNLDKRVETTVGDNVYSGVKGKEIADGDSATTAIGKLNNRMNDIYTTAGQHSSVSTADTNLTLSESKNTSGGTDYKIGLNKDQINLGNLTIKGNEGSIEANSIKSDSFTAGDTVVNKDGIKVGDQSALTGDSLKVNGKTYVDDKGVNANGQVIRNVGDGKNDGDAVNVKQVNELAARQGEAINQNAAHINQLDRAVNRLDSRINRVGAGAAALAALHPGNYDPDDKVDFAAGFGNYRGASAAAVGMYYHPDETTTMSVGASFGGGENMVNAGITWKMGKDSGHMRTQAATKAVPVQFVAAPTQTTQPTGQTEGTKMPQPVTAVTTTASGQQVPIVAAYLPSVDNSTRAENDELKELLARQTAILEKLADQKTAPAQAAAPVSGEDLFPDVPENHWAYDFVAKLAQAGALKDCRVEDPANNPMLTRNDFAQILYTALKNGATKNPALNKDGGLNHLANEFRAELKNVKR